MNVCARNRVLLIDDNVFACELAESLFALEGFEARSAHSGSEGIVAAVEFSPNIIFIDLGLPDIDGLQVAQTLRAVPSTGKTWLVALTGWDDPKTIDEIDDAGFDQRLTKPANFNDMLQLAVSRKNSLVDINGD